MDDKEGSVTLPTKALHIRLPESVNVTETENPVEVTLYTLVALIKG